MCGLFKKLWSQYRFDVCPDPQDVGASSNPLEIFGFFRKSNKRGFSRSCLVLGVRPLEMWEKSLDERESLNFLMDGPYAKVGILFECEDGSRIMGVIDKREYQQMITESIIGKKCVVAGVFEFMHLVKKLNVYLFFRIVNLEF